MSVSIIGGADGPTAIFLAADWGRLLLAALAAGAAAALLLARRHRRKKNAK